MGPVNKSRVYIIMYSKLNLYRHFAALI